jgi:hypothetical protein
VDAAASGAQTSSQGGLFEFVSGGTARRRTALKRTAKSCGPGTRCWSQAAGLKLVPREGKNPDCRPVRGYRGAFRKDGMPATVTDVPVEAAALGKLDPQRQDIPQSRPHSRTHRVH